MRTGGALVLFTLATYMWIGKSLVDHSLHHVASSQLDSASRFKRIEEERDRLKVCHVVILSWCHGVMGHARRPSS